jgi:DNA-binding IclR family transcriptional regulator
MTTVQSVERAFSVLRSLAAGPAGVSEIAERTDLPKSTVYGLGELIIDLSASASPGRNLVTIARPHLEELAMETDEAAGLSILDGTEVYYLDQIDSHHEVQVRDWTGESVDAHVVPSGLIMLAYATDDLRDQVLEGPLTARTDNSTVDPAVLRHRLEEIRRVGFAWGYEEMSLGLNSVAAPIVNPSNTVIAAVHVHGPSYRFPKPGESARVAAAVVDAAVRVSERLAGRHRPDGDPAQTSDDGG